MNICLEQVARQLQAARERSKERAMKNPCLDIDIPASITKSSLTHRLRNNRPRPRSLNESGPIREWKADIELEPGRLGSVRIYSPVLPNIYFYEHEQKMFYLQGIMLDGTLFFSKERPCSKA